MLLLISGPSTIGKNSRWLEAAESLGFRREVPYTTRQLREGEVDGVDYHFVTCSEFQEMIKTKSLLEWDYTIDNYYGVGADLQQRLTGNEKIVVQILGRMGLRLKSRLNEVFTILLLPCNQSILERRLATRQPACSKRELHLRTFHREEEQTHAPLFDLVVPSAESRTREEIVAILGQITIAE